MVEEAPPFVIWIDDEPNLLDAEIYDLIDNGVATLPCSSVSDAYDMIIEDEMRAQSATAILIDAMMPSRSDKRFESPDGLPAGAMLCSVLSKRDIWGALKKKIIIYTRLPRGDTYERLLQFASKEEIVLLQKSGSSRIALAVLNQVKRR